MEKSFDRIGEKYTVKSGQTITIIDYSTLNKYTIMFDCGYIKKEILYADIRRGQIKYPFHKSVCGVGYFGVGIYKARINSKVAPVYALWISILNRCYNEGVHQRHPTYKDVTVYDEWHNFQNFAKWHEENYKPHMAGWHLDKDILIKGNKVYSPETCCFVPQEINNQLAKCDKVRGEYPIGVQKSYKKYVAAISINKETIPLGRFNNPEEAFKVYKVAKEKYIKELANKWRDQIVPKVYSALINYKVEITD